MLTIFQGSLGFIALGLLLRATGFARGVSRRKSQSRLFKEESGGVLTSGGFSFVQMKRASTVAENLFHQCCCFFDSNWTGKCCCNLTSIGHCATSFVHSWQFNIILTGHVTVLANASRSAVSFTGRNHWLIHHPPVLCTRLILPDRPGGGYGSESRASSRKPGESAEAHFGFILCRKEKRENREHGWTGTKTHRRLFTARGGTVNAAWLSKLNMQINLAVRSRCGPGIPV